MLNIFFWSNLRYSYDDKTSMYVPSFTLGFWICIICTWSFINLYLCLCAFDWQILYLLSQTLQPHQHQSLTSQHNLMAQSPNYHHQGTFSVQGEMTVVCSGQTGITIRPLMPKSSFSPHIPGDFLLTPYMILNCEMCAQITESTEEKGKLSIFGESALWRRSSKKLGAQTWFQKFS